MLYERSYGAFELCAQNIHTTKRSIFYDVHTLYEQPKAQKAASSDLIADMSDYKTNSEQYGNCMSKQMSGGAGVLNVANDRAYATPCDFCRDDA